MKLSIIMSVYNTEPYLQETMVSVLSQSFGEFEFLIMDDGSTDRSYEILSSYSDKRIRLFRQKNAGLSKSLNKLIDQAKTDYIVRIDADDICSPERFKLQFEYMETNNKCLVLGSNAHIIDQHGKYLYTSDLPTAWKDIMNVLPNSPFYHSSTIIRKKQLLSVGCYNSEVTHHFEDIILWSQLAKIGEFANLSQALISYRLVPSAITNRSVKNSKKMVSITNKMVNDIKLSMDDKIFIENINRPKSKAWKESNYYLNIGKIFLEKNIDRSKAVRNFVHSIIYNPMNLTSWFNLILSFFPGVVIKYWKTKRAF